MKLYVVTTISSGEVSLEIDRQKIFLSKDDAKVFFEEAYKDIVKMIEGYNLIDVAKQYDYFLLQIDDEYCTAYCGEIREIEVDVG